MYCEYRMVRRDESNVAWTGKGLNTVFRIEVFCDDMGRLLWQNKWLGGEYCRKQNILIRGGGALPQTVKINKDNIFEAVAVIKS